MVAQRYAACWPRMLRPGGGSVLAHTLPVPARLGADSMRHPTHGSKRSSVLAATRTRCGEDARNESLRPISATVGVGLAYAAVTRHTAGPPRAAACRMMPTCVARRISGAAETRPQRGFRVDFPPRAPGRADHHGRSD